MDRLPYTYRLKHMVSGRYYYGSRTCKGCSPADLFVKYFSSSDEVQSLIKRDGKDSFEIEIRRIFNSPEDALAWEAKVLRRIIRFPLVMNRHTIKGFSPKAASEGAKKQWAALKVDPAAEKAFNVKRGIAVSKTIRHKASLGLNVMKRSFEVSQRGGLKGGATTAKTYLSTDRSKLVVSNYMRASMWITDGRKNKRLLPEKALLFLSLGWREGMTKDFS